MSTEPNIYEGHAARHVLTALFSIVDSVKKIWADGGYRGAEFPDDKSKLGNYTWLIKQMID